MLLGFRDFMVMSWGFDQENGDMSGVAMVVRWAHISFDDLRAEKGDSEQLC